MSRNFELKITTFLKKEAQEVTSKYAVYPGTGFIQLYLSCALLSVDISFTNTTLALCKNKHPRHIIC